MASLEVDLSKVDLGSTITVKWRGKPVFVRHRTPEEVKDAEEVDVKTLRDPQTDEERVQQPEVRLIVVVLHKHLLCRKVLSPLSPSDEDVVKTWTMVWMFCN